MTRPWPRDWSLRTRLVVTTVAAACAAVALLIVGVQLLLARIATSESLDVLGSRADAAASTIRTVDGRPRVLETPADSLDQNLWIFDRRGRLIDGATAAGPLGETVGRLSGARVERTLVVSGYRLLARPVTVRHGEAVTAVVVAGLDLAPYETSERRGLWLSLALGVMAVVSAGVASWAAARYSLRHVQQMVRRADDWREHDLSRRFELGKPVDELTELGNTLDQMLDRIANALRSERRLTDEVAHELRTPLAVIRSEAQLALLSPEDSGSGREAFGAIIDATEQMDGSITTMLAVARSANSAGERCDVTEVIERAVNESTARPGIVLTAEPPSAVLSVDAPPPVVKAALAPLVDNALRHARSGVRIDAHTANGRVLVTVEDDGPGVSDEQRHSIFDPGHSTVQGGAGLGLPLARRLASSIGAELHDRSHGQGLFVLDLPRSE